MANIIWSFGIALSAQDQATGPITDVITSLNTMEKSLATLNNRQLGNAQTVKDLTEAYRQLNAELGVYSGVDQAAAISRNAASAIGDVAGSVGSAVGEGGELALEGVEAFVSGGVTLVIGGVTRLVKGVVSVISSIASGLFSAITTIVSTAATIVSKVVSTVVSLAWSLTKGVASTLAGVILSPINLIKTILDTDLLSKASRGVEKFLTLGDSFGPVDQSLRQLTAQMGGTSSQANRLIDTVINMGISTGISVEHLRDLAVALGKTGQNLSDIKPDAAKTLAKLSDIFGLGADETVRFSSAARRIGVDIKELAGTAATFGEKFGIPNLMSIMPGLTNMAAESITKFSKNVIGSQKQLIETTLRTSAIYSKAFGKDIGEATRLAQATFEGFAGAAQQNSDLMLGLSDSIAPLGMALLQGGAKFAEMNQIIREGTEDPLTAAAHIRNLIDSMVPGPAQERFKRLLQKDLPEGMKQLVFDNDVYTRGLKQQAYAQAANTEAITSGTKNFDAMSDALRDNFSTLRMVADNVIAAIKSLFGALFTDTMRASLKDVVGNFEHLGMHVSDLVTTVRGSAVFQTIQKSFQSIAGYLLTAGKGAGLMVDGLLSLSTVTGILAPVSSALEGLSGLLSKSIIGGTLSVTAFFGGLGHMLVGSFATGVNGEKGKLRKVVEDLFESAKDQAREVLAGWDQDIGTDLDATFGRVGKNIGSKIGEIAKTVADFVKGLFDAKQRSEVMSRLTLMFATTATERGSIASSLVSITRKAFSAVKTFLNEFSNGVLGPFGTNTDIFFEGLGLKFKDFVVSIKEAFYGISDVLISSFKAVMPVLKDIGAGLMDVASSAIGAKLYAEEVAHPVDWKNYQNAIDKAQDSGRAVAILQRDQAKALRELNSMTDTEKGSWGGLVDSDRTAKEKEYLAFNEKIAEARKKSVEADKDLAHNADYEKFKALEKQQQKLEGIGNKMRGFDTSFADTQSQVVADKLKALSTDRENLEIEKTKNVARQQEFEATQKLHQALGGITANQEAFNDAVGKGAAALKTEKEVVAPDNGPEAAPVSKDDIRSNYEKMLKATDKPTADTWLDTWMRDGFDPNSMPAIPEEGEAEGAPPAKSNMQSPVGVPSKMATPPLEQGAEDLPAIKEMLAQVMRRQSEPVDIRFSYDGPTTQHLVRVSMNGENAQLG